MMLGCTHIVEHHCVANPRALLLLLLLLLLSTLLSAAIVVIVQQLPPKFPVHAMSAQPVSTPPHVRRSYLRRCTLLRV